MGVHCHCSHVNYIIYEHFNRSLHVGSLNFVLQYCIVQSRCSEQILIVTGVRISHKANVVPQFYTINKLISLYCNKNLVKIHF